jgi:TBC1 domain family member 2
MPHPPPQDDGIFATALRGMSLGGGGAGAAAGAAGGRAAGTVTRGGRAGGGPSAAGAGPAPEPGSPGRRDGGGGGGGDDAEGAAPPAAGGEGGGGGDAGGDAGGGGGGASPPPPAAPPPAPAPAPAATGPPARPPIRGSVRAGGLVWDDGDVLPSRAGKLGRLLDSRAVELEDLRGAAWAGVPPRYRAAVWQMLLGYLPLNRDRQADSIARKQAEYQTFVATLCGPRGAAPGGGGGGGGGAGAGAGSGGGSVTPSGLGGGLGDADAALLRQVLYDVKRMSPRTPLMTVDAVQRSLERVLYVFAQRHFATGYVQGLNDVASPFFVVFLSPWADPSAKSLDHVPADALLAVEADVYWCLSRLVEGVQDHYMPSQPGIQRMIHALRELVHRMDEALVTHLESNSVEFHTFAFRWMNCLLLRELPLPLVVRLWDTYLAETRSAVKDGFATFHVFVCAALLLKFRARLKEMKFQDLLSFLHNLPTADWTVKDVEELLSQAYVYQTSFAGSPSHLK